MEFILGFDARESSSLLNDACMALSGTRLTRTVLAAVIFAGGSESHRFQQNHSLDAVHNRTIFQTHLQKNPGRILGEYLAKEGASRLLATDAAAEMAARATRKKTASYP